MKHWTLQQLREAIRLVNRGNSVYLFRGAYWDWRMLSNAVDCEFEYWKDKLKKGR